jgi:hypothetical protein
MSRSGPPRRFEAPIGTRVKVITALPFALVLTTAGILAWQIADGRERLTVLLLLGVVLPAALAVIAGFSFIAGYRVHADTVEVLRVGRVNRLPLAGLAAVEVDPEALRRSWKVTGNDGLGAMTGSFRYRKLGVYQAFVTDPARSVVLRWPGRIAVVSPDRPHEFAAEVRQRVGLRA